MGHVYVFKYLTTTCRANIIVLVSRVRVRKILSDGDNSDKFRYRLNYTRLVRQTQQPGREKLPTQIYRLKHQVYYHPGSVETRRLESTLRLAPDGLNIHKGTPTYTTCISRTTTTTDSSRPSPAQYGPYQVLLTYIVSSREI